jgi:hypothetical protein
LLGFLSIQNEDDCDSASTFGQENSHGQYSTQSLPISDSFSHGLRKAKVSISAEAIFNTYRLEPHTNRHPSIDLALIAALPQLHLIDEPCGCQAEMVVRRGFPSRSPARDRLRTSRCRADPAGGGNLPFPAR